jgi:hypothetical protein
VEWAAEWLGEREAAVACESAMPELLSPDPVRG